MKNYILPFLIFIAFFSYSNAQTVTIGSQIWTTKNLDVSTFRNGDTIPQVQTDKAWMNAGDNKQPAWCYYDNDPANGEKYGKLYNWYAINDSRGLAPVGYHIPSDAEWKKLQKFIDGKYEIISGSQMKSKSGWNEFSNEYITVPKSGNGTNTSGFSGLPGGNRTHFGTFVGIGRLGYWWSTTEWVVEEHVEEHGPTSCWGLYLHNGDDISNRYPFGKGDGVSVRCLKD